MRLPNTERSNPDNSDPCALGRYRPQEVAAPRIETDGSIGRSTAPEAPRPVPRLLPGCCQTLMMAGQSPVGEAQVLAEAASELGYHAARHRGVADSDELQPFGSGAGAMT